MADADLKEFERSLRQLELLAETPTPDLGGGSGQKRANTRDQQSRSKIGDDPQEGDDLGGHTFLMQPNGKPLGSKLQHLVTENEAKGADEIDKVSGGKFNRTHGGVSTRKPSNSDLNPDSLINSAGNMYEQMKRNMEQAIQKKDERAQRQKTIREIKDRDESERHRARQRSNTIDRSKRTSPAKSPIKYQNQSPQRSDTKRSQASSPERRRNNTINFRSPERERRQSSPRFRDPSSDGKRESPIRQRKDDRRSRQHRSPPSEADDDYEVPIPPPTIEQIREQHRMNALKVVDLYRQLQNSPLLAVIDLKENQIVAAEIDLHNLNNSRVDDSQREMLPVAKSPKKTATSIGAGPTQLTNAAKNPTNEELLTSTLVHVLSAFAIAEAQQDIFLRVKNYVITADFALPKLNGIYASTDFGEVRTTKTSYLHFLFSQALQTAIHANWISMAHAILIHAKETRISVSLSRMDLSVLLGNANYELMNLLVDYGAYFDLNERSIEAEKLALKEAGKTREQGLVDPLSPSKVTNPPESDLESISARERWNQTGFRKINSDFFRQGSARSSQKGGTINSSPFKSKNAPSEHDNYARVVSNLDQTLQSMRSNSFGGFKGKSGGGHETTMMQNLKRGLVAGHSQLNTSHFVRQLYDDRVSNQVNSFENHERFQKQIRALLKALSKSAGFEQVIPLMVLRGNRDLVYDMLTDKRKSKFDFELSFTTQKQLALEFFCFSVSQEQHDEALNVLMKFNNHLTQAHRIRCLTEITSALKRSGAFLELKLLLLSHFYARLTRQEAVQILDIFETYLLGKYTAQTAQKIAILQNLNGLRTSLLALYMIEKLGKLVPHSDKRVRILTQKVIDQEAKVLDHLAHSDYDKVILSASRKDLFGHDVLYYLAHTQPGRLLQCQVIQKLVEQHWSAAYFSCKTHALLECSTSAQIVFQSRLGKPIDFKSFLTGRDSNSPASSSSSGLSEANDHILTCMDIQAWKQGINVRYTVDLVAVLALIAFTQYVTIKFVDVDYKLDIEGNLESFLLAFVDIERPEEVNGVVPSAGAYFAYTYCFILGCYLLASLITKSILSSFYLFHTGFKTESQAISLADSFVAACTSVYALFYFYVLLREPQFYEQIEVWGELITDARMLSFYANLHNLDNSSLAIVGPRFWPFLVVLAMWVYFFSRLQMHRAVGTYIIMIRLCLYEFAKFVLLWLTSLLFFGCITLVWFGDFTEYGDLGSALQSLYLVTLGLQETPDSLVEPRLGPYRLLHLAFTAVNLIAFLSFLTALMTHTLVQARGNLTNLQNAYFIHRLPPHRYCAKMGWVATSPLLLAPFFLVFVYPCHLLAAKCIKGANRAFNGVICTLVFAPVGIAQVGLFVAINLLLVPFAWVGGVYQLAVQNPYQDSKKKRNKALRVLAYVFLGLPLLVLAQFPNAFNCFKMIFLPRDEVDALKAEKKRQMPVNIRNIQRMYQAVQSELVALASPQTQVDSLSPNLFGNILSHQQLAKRSRDQLTGKALLEKLRESLGVTNCVKMLFFGSIPGFHKGSSRFMYQLRKEDQTVTSQLEAYNMLKKQVLSFREQSTQGGEVRLGLLFQYLQEIKMKVVAMKTLKHYKKGRELNQIEFLSIPRTDSVDELAREILIADPQAVLLVLQAECQASQSLKEGYLAAEIQKMKAQILSQMRSQGLTQQLLAGATMEQVRDNQSAISEGVDPRRYNQNAPSSENVTSYHFAIAQQEAVNGIVRRMQTIKVPKVKEVATKVPIAINPTAIAPLESAPDAQREEQMTTPLSGVVVKDETLTPGSESPDKTSSHSRSAQQQPQSIFYRKPLQ